MMNLGGALLHADIVKIATMANDIVDAAQVLSLLRDPIGEAHTQPSCSVRTRARLVANSVLDCQHHGMALSRHRVGGGSPLRPLGRPQAVTRRAREGQSPTC